MLQRFQNYEISDDATRLDLDAIERFLGRSYWAATRGRDVIERSIENSICYGGYLAGNQVAFARVVTDRAVIFWLADVFVIEEHRGRGLGQALMRVVLTDPRIENLAGLLATKDAHGFYERFGFRREGERLMARLPSTLNQTNYNAPAQDQSSVA